MPTLIGMGDERPHGDYMVNFEVQFDESSLVLGIRVGGTTAKHLTFSL